MERYTATDNPEEAGGGIATGFTFSILLLAAILLGVPYLILQRILAWYRLRHIKGPFWAAFSDFWLIRNTWGGQMYLELASVCDQYGSLARIGPNYVLTSDPSVLRRIWGVRSPYVRSQWYDAMRLNPSKDNSLSQRDLPKHNELKSKLAPGYAGKGIHGLEETIDLQISNFVKLIDEKYISTSSSFRPIDFARKAQFLTLDVISAIAFGKPIGYLVKDEDLYDYIKTTEETVPNIILVGVIPWLMKVLQSPLMKFFLPSDKDTLGLGRIMGIAKSEVSKRFGTEKIMQRDMLGSFITHGLSQEDAESESLVQIIAGSDTTATAIRSTMLHIITSPQSYTKLQSEVDAAIQSHGISSPITDAEAKKLPYLQACIKEGLRIWPPITGLMPKVSPTDDFINGQLVPAGTQICWCAWRVFRNKDIFGEDAEMFRPERWLEADEQRLKIMESTAELAFSPGRWQCLGRSIAFIELNKVFVELFRRFDFQIVDPTNPWWVYNAGIFIQKNMILRVTRREGSH